MALLSATPDLIVEVPVVVVVVVVVVIVCDFHLKYCITGVISAGVKIRLQVISSMIAQSLLDLLKEFGSLIPIDLIV